MENKKEGVKDIRWKEGKKVEGVREKKRERKGWLGGW